MRKNLCTVFFTNDHSEEEQVTFRLGFESIMARWKINQIAMINFIISILCVNQKK